MARTRTHYIYAPDRLSAFNMGLAVLRADLDEMGALQDRDAVGEGITPAKAIASWANARQPVHKGRRLYLMDFYSSQVCESTRDGIGHRPEVIDRVAERLLDTHINRPAGRLYVQPQDVAQALGDTVDPAPGWQISDYKNIRDMSPRKIIDYVREHGLAEGGYLPDRDYAYTNMLIYLTNGKIRLDHLRGGGWAAHLASHAAAAYCEMWGADLETTVIRPIQYVLAENISQARDMFNKAIGEPWQVFFTPAQAWAAAINKHGPRALSLNLYESRRGLWAVKPATAASVGMQASHARMIATQAYDLAKEKGYSEAAPIGPGDIGEQFEAFRLKTNYVTSANGQVRAALPSTVLERSAQAAAMPGYVDIEDVMRVTGGGLKLRDLGKSLTVDKAARAFLWLWGVGEHVTIRGGND